VDWSQHLTPDHTLAVDCNVRDSQITHSHYAALKTKDAICDQFMDKVGRRPSVDVETPMLFLNLHIYKDDAVLTLHKRGYRPIQTKAPLNEALAAGLVLLTGWRGESAFADPLCGSGTLCIEAGWMALHRPPGLTRRRFNFQGWMDFNVALWTHLRDEARRQGKKKLDIPIAGSDARRDVINSAKENAKAAGIGNHLRFEVKKVEDFEPPPGEPGVILCNPPYGERIGEEKDLIGLYRSLGEVFRTRCAGWKVFVFTGNARLARQLGMKPIAQVHLFNGRIPCRLLRFEV
jgi:putative N6-adenine-specific DNA methylase